MARRRIDISEARRVEDVAPTDAARAGRSSLTPERASWSPERSGAIGAVTT